MFQPIIHTCPRCGTPYTLTPEYLAQYGGQTTVCTNCGGQFVLPGPAAAAGQAPVAQQFSAPAQQAAPGQLPAAGQAQPVLPYAGPQWGVATAGAWSEGRLIVAAKDASVAHACVKCGGPPAGRPFRRMFRWHQPIIYLTILAGLLIYVIIALCVQEKGRVEYALCERHRRRRRNAILGGWLLTFAGIGMFVLAGVQEEVVWVPFGILAFIGGLVWAIVGAQTLRPEKIDARFVWLKGAGEDFLRTLPPVQSPGAYYPQAAPAYATATPQ
jgi:hypothetical protein